MFITRQADYAVRGAIYLARHPGRSASVTEIAAAILVPRAFLAKIVQRLMKAGLVTATRGVTGGFRLARPAKKITLLDIIEAIQGPSAANRCALDRRACALSDRCAAHPVWVRLRAQAERELKKQTLAALARPR